jgi:hypothetical protein
MNSQYNCDKCGKHFTRKENLSYHKNKKVCIGKDFNCKLCGCLFSSNESLSNHLKSYCEIKKIYENNDVLIEKVICLNELVIEAKNEIEKLHNEISDMKKQTQSHKELKQGVVRKLIEIKKRKRTNKKSETVQLPSPPDNLVKKYIKKVVSDEPKKTGCVKIVKYY